MAGQKLRKYKSKAKRMERGLSVLDGQEMMKGCGWTGKEERNLRESAGCLSVVLIA